MSKFKVILTRDTTESAIISIEADNKEAAEDKVIELGTSSYNELKWEPDENYPLNPYITDVEKD